VGQNTGSKPINLHQLEDEIVAAGVTVSYGLVMTDGFVFTCGADGISTDFPSGDQPTVDQAIANHVAMRDKTGAEYAEEFQNPETPPARKQEIRDIQNGLMPPEQVPITQQEWDEAHAPVGAR